MSRDAFRWIPVDVLVSLGVFANKISARASVSPKRLNLPPRRFSAGGRVVTAYGWSEEAILSRLRKRGRTLQELDRALESFRAGEVFPVAEAGLEPLWPQDAAGPPPPADAEVNDHDSLDEEIWKSLHDHQQGSGEGTGESSKYIFLPGQGHGGEGLYIFNAPHPRDPPIRMDLAGPRGLRRLWTMYAPTPESGLRPWSVNKICDEFEIPRSWFMAIKKALRLTHDSGPAPPEEVAQAVVDGRQDALASDVLARAYAQLRRDAAAEARRQNDLDAAKWRDAQTAIEDLVVRIGAIRAEPPPPKAPSEVVPDRALLAFDCTTDAHVGLMPYDGTDAPYDGEEVSFVQQQMMEYAVRQGRIHTAAVLAGSDWLDVSTYYKTTDKGTQQYLSVPVEDLPELGWRLQKQRIQRWRSVADRVVVLVTPGNHDKMATAFYRVLLQETFGGQEDVEIVWSRKERAYLRWGSTVFGATHGDTARAPSLVELMVDECPYLDGASRRIWVVGHTHLSKSQKRQSVVIETAPALSASTTYSAAHYGVSDRESLLITVDPSSNYFNRHIVRLPPEKEKGARAAAYIDPEL